MVVLLTATLLLAACAVLGRGLLALAGANRSAWYGPAVGLAALLCLSLITVKLPGRATTALAFDVVAVIAASAGLAWGRRGNARQSLRRRPSWPLLAAVVLAGAAAGIPFVASDRVGLLGMGIDNDLALHLLWAEGLVHPSVNAWAALVTGYPLGPHSLAIALTQLGVRLDLAFQALMLAVVPMTVLAAGAFAPQAAGWRRVAVALAGGLAYLVSAFYGQGSFKEPMLALALLAFVGYARDVSRAPIGGTLAALRAVVPAVLLLAGGVYTFSHAALGWFGGFLAVWALVAAVANPWALRPLARRALGRQALARNAAVTGGALLLFVLVLLPQLDGIRSFGSAIGADPAGSAAIPVTNLGNLAGPLSGYEMFGIWLHADFRFAAANLFSAGMWSAVAVGAVGLGLLISVSARDFALPAAAAASVAIYWYSQRTQSPYVTAKAQVIAAPVLMTMAATALVGYPRGMAWTGVQALRLGLGALVIGAALYSSSLALRFSAVAHDAAPLRDLASKVGQRPTLFLGHDDFASSEMFPARLAIPAPEGARPLPVRLNDRPWAYGNPLDWDLVPADWLDTFDFVVIPDGRFSSQPPPNFELVDHAGTYDLFARKGPTRPRESFDGQGSPGAVMRCDKQPFRGLAQKPGTAAVMDQPVVVNPGAVAPGSHVDVPLTLPPGRWDLSVSYTSPQKLAVTATGTRAGLPAYLGRPGPYFAAGQVASTGAGQPTVVSIAVDRPSPLTSPDMPAQVTALAATRAGDRQLVPLAQACGRYVDWYRVASAG